MLLQKFTSRCVQLVAIAVERNVASGNHDAALGSCKCKVRQSWSRDAPQIDRPHSSIANSALDRLADLSIPLLFLDELRGTWAQIAGEVELLAADDAAIGSGDRLQVLQFT